MRQFQIILRMFEEIGVQRGKRTAKYIEIIFVCLSKLTVFAIIAIFGRKYPIINLNKKNKFQDNLIIFMKMTANTVKRRDRHTEKKSAYFMK